MNIDQNQLPSIPCYDNATGQQTEYLPNQSIQQSQTLLTLEELAQQIKEYQRKLSEIEERMTTFTTRLERQSKLIGYLNQLIAMGYQYPATYKQSDDDMIVGSDSFVQPSQMNTLNQVQPLQQSHQINQINQITQTNQMNQMNDLTHQSMNMVMTSSSPHVQPQSQHQIQSTTQLPNDNNLPMFK